MEKTLQSQKRRLTFFLGALAIVIAVPLITSSAFAKSGGKTRNGYLADGGVMIKAPAEIQLVSHDPCAQVFEIELIGEEGADYFYVTAEEVLKAVPAVNAEELKNPDQVLNRKLTLGKGKKIIFHPASFYEQRKTKNGCPARSDEEE